MLNKPVDENNNPHPDALHQYMRLRKMFTEQQLSQVLSGIERVCERSIDRDEHQTIAIVFIKGRPRHLKASDDLELRP